MVSEGDPPNRDTKPKGPRITGDGWSAPAEHMPRRGDRKTTDKPGKHPSDNEGRETDRTREGRGREDRPRGEGGKGRGRSKDAAPAEPEILNPITPSQLAR